MLFAFLRNVVNLIKYGLFTNKGSTNALASLAKIKRLQHIMIHENIHKNLRINASLPIAPKSNLFESFHNYYQQNSTKNWVESINKQRVTTHHVKGFRRRNKQRSMDLWVARAT